MDKIQEIIDLVEDLEISGEYAVDTTPTIIQKLKELSNNKDTEILDYQMRKACEMAGKEYDPELCRKSLLKDMKQTT